MRKYVVSPAAEILPGTHKVFTVGGRPIGIYWGAYGRQLAKWHQSCLRTAK